MNKKSFKAGIHLDNPTMQFITPPAASRPNALPPLSNTAWIVSAAATGRSSSDSREAGPPPRTSRPAAAPCGHSNTVQPVAAAASCALPR